jgi:D-amino peptidase
VKIGVTFLASHFADAAELLPIVKRIDGLKVEYTTSNMVKAYKTFELLALAASGISAILQNTQ